MTFIKHNRGGILFISSILIINTLIWVLRMNAEYYNINNILAAVSGATLLMGFFIVFLLATRMKWLVTLFGGLDNTYFWHRTLSIATTASIFVHGITVEGIRVFSGANIFPFGPSGEAGELARNLFLFLIAFALLAKFLNYEHFRFLHRLLIVPYVISIYHGFFSSQINLFSFDLISIWMIATSAIGLASSLYMILIYQTTAFKHKGIIVQKDMVSDSIVELKVKMNKTFQLIPGQFVFIKIQDANIDSASHPFSISGQDGDYIYFTIKALGDFTDTLIKSLETPARINITRPYGSMTFQNQTKKQVWVAGGIGVTPFLGYLRSNQTAAAPIHLVYSVKYMEEAVHLDLLQSLASTNEHFTFTLFESSKQGFLTSTHLDLDDDTTVSMCGPRPMVQSLLKQISEHHPHTTVHFEAFSFTGTLVEDSLRIAKRIVSKLQFAR